MKRREDIFAVTTMQKLVTIGGFGGMKARNAQVRIVIYEEEITLRTKKVINTTIL